MEKKLLALIILDGWGISNTENSEYNAIKLANTKNFDKLIEQYPNIELNVSGNDVGLPEGLMGNSEVGHLNIGAGRIVYQDITRINLAIKENKLKDMEQMSSFISYIKENNKTVHLMGLLSDGGVHTHINHLFALIELFKNNNITDIVIHPFLDGRDTPPRSGINYISQLQEKLNELGVGKIGTVMGRYYAMDRDQRWERVKQAYDGMVFGKGETAKDAIEAINNSYEKNINDEFLLPTVIVDNDNNPIGQISDGDALFFFNFRGDRAREITRSFVDKKFDNFERKANFNIKFLSITEYDNTIDAPVLFAPEKIENIFAQVLADNNLKQLHIAETEKYAHVTFFFNGGVEQPVKDEDRILVPSPKVPTYDLKPEMSAYEVKDKVINAINQDKYDVVILNFANPDMVGHTGILEAAVEAIEAVDDCLGQIVDTILAKNGALLISADHGNAEMMHDPSTDQAHTAHTTNRVPFIMVDNKTKKTLIKEPGKLADIAPTALEILGIKKPEEMTGVSLISKQS